MTPEEQKAGEARVETLLIEPLKRRGLARPAGLTVEQFGEMQKEICAKLAYMSDLNLMALEEQSAGNPSGTNRDRFPIANNILQWAATIQPPADSGSPLVRAILASRLGADAIDGGWSPELIQSVKKTRRWPNSYAVEQLKQSAADVLAKMREWEAMIREGRELPSGEARYRSDRLATIDRHKEIRALASEGTA